MKITHTKNTQIKYTILKSTLTFIGFLLLFLGTGFNASAQAPGYLGKRFMIGLELPMVAGYDRHKNDFYYKKETESGGIANSDETFIPLYYKVKPTFYLEFVLNRKASIQAFGRFFSSKVDVTPFYDTLGIYGTKELFEPIGRAKAKTMSFGLKYRLFTGDGLSPVGKYLSFGVEYASNKFEFEDRHFITENGYEVNTREPINDPINTIVLTYGFGTQHPLGKSLIFNMGGEIGLPFSVFWSDDVYDTPQTEEWMKVNSKNNFFRSYIFNITIGLALIP